MKKLFFSVVFLFALLLAFAIFVVPNIDVNQYKPKIAALVHKKTGRNLTITGDIKLSLFPWAGMKISGVHLSDAKGFDTQDFMRVDQAAVRVKLLPLLQREIQIGQITLRGLSLHLLKNKQGRTNWQDLFATSETHRPTSSDSTSNTQKPLDFKIAGIDIKDAQLTWQDATKNSYMAITHLHLRSGHIQDQLPFSIQSDFDFSTQKQASWTHVALTTALQMNTQKSHYRLKNSKLALSKADKPSIHLSIPQLILDQRAAFLTIPGATVSCGSQHANFQLQANRIFQDPIFTGSLQVPTFDLKSALAKSGSPMPTQGKKALRSVAFHTKFNGTARTLNLDDLRLRIDSSTLSGTVALSDFSNPNIKFSLALNQINLDNYLPAQSKAASSAARGPSSTPGYQTPAQDSKAHLKRAQIQGTFSVSKLALGETVLEKLSTQVALKNGVLTLNPLRASVYGGTAQGKARLDLSGAQPTYQIDQNLSNVAIDQVLPSKRLTGLANIRTHLTTTGKDNKTLLGNLNGNLQFDIQKGALIGVNIAYQIKRALALFQKQPLPPAPATNQTVFNTFRGTGRITRGVFHNNDLRIQSDHLTATGSGSANLVTQMLNYRLSVVGSTANLGNPSETARQITLPVIIGGTFEKPVIRPDVRALMQNQISHKIADRVEKYLPEKGKALLQQWFQR